MKTFFKFASIPLVLFIALFAFPKLVAFLINAHSDAALAGLVTIVCGIFGIFGYKLFKKEISNNEAP